MTRRRLFALLVGINDYEEGSPVSALRGCVNDVQGMQAYLEGRVDREGVELVSRVLLNEQATRQAVIDGFREHLCKAGPEDIAFFYYAGHGAQAFAPEAFWPIEPDKLLETLVCYDSRTDHSWDIADKELRQLIANVAAKNPHIAVILDCCHSGSGTRSIGTRHAETDYRQRPLESFVLPIDQTNQTRSLSSEIKTETEFQLPSGRHVLLSACQDIEEAKEYQSDDGEYHGSFSYFLLESLKTANGSLSYRDLFKRTNALVRNNIRLQSPQMEATETADLEQPFLGGAIAPSPASFTARKHPKDGWILDDGGAIHGIVAPQGDETTLLALFPFDSESEDLQQVSQAVAEAEVTEVLPQRSKLKITRGEENLTDPTFKAVIIGLPLPQITVSFEGDETGIDLVREALNQAGPDLRPSLYIRESEHLDAAHYKLLAHNGSYSICRRGETPLRSDVSATFNKIDAKEIVQKLEHMARWSSIAALASPANSRIQGSVKMEIFVGENKEQAVKVDNSQMRLSYEYNEVKAKWDQPIYRVKLVNNSNETLYCGILGLSEQYEVTPLLENSTTVRLRPKQELWVDGGEPPFYGEVLKELWEKGVTETQDILKLIACTDEWDPTLLRLDELGSKIVGTTRSAKVGKGTLNHLMQRVVTRSTRRRPAEEDLYDDWFASQITFTYVRPKEATAISSDEPITLLDGLTVQPHSNLQANVGLTTATQSTRDNVGLVTTTRSVSDVGSPPLPPLLREGLGIEPIQFTTTRGADPGLSVLELNNVENSDAVTPDNPLRLSSDIALAEGEYILPVAYDGEFFLPLGYGKSEGGQTQITLEYLTEPQPGAVTSRSIHGSIQIYFQKVITRKLGKTLSKQVGLEYNYPRLAIAELQDGQVKYNHDQAEVQARVTQAQTVALYTHGIFGDTEWMLTSLKTEITQLDGESKPISQLYDLVLAFDYENINTSIDRNALLLKKRLNDVGLGANHGKQLHIIAHSMGGLVSRYFIEEADGNQVVQHLIMLGTPNAGSPWPQVQAGVTAAVALAVNGLSLAIRTSQASQYSA